MSQAFSGGHHPLGMDLRSAMPADADDVALLLTEMGYPCDIDDALERIGMILDNDRQALIVARRDGVVCGLVALDFMYYLPLGTITCRVTALVVTPTAQGLGIGRQLLKESNDHCAKTYNVWQFEELTNIDPVYDLFKSQGYKPAAAPAPQSAAPQKAGVPPWKKK